MSLIITQLCKTYPNGTKALNHLQLTIEPGMFGLLGPNGAGKSSLMRTIATLQRPDSGSVTFDGIHVLHQPTELQKVLGYLPQSFGVYPGLSANRLLDYFGLLKGISSKKERAQIIDEVLEITNLQDVRKKAVSGYSGGMKQRFGIAQLLMNRPKLIIVDEPTAGLDPAERARFLNVLREIGTSNTVIFSTHIVDDVTDLCTDMAIINQGQVVRHQPPQKFIQELRGTIWCKQISKEELDDHQRTRQVVSTSYNSDNSLTIRVFDEKTPGAAFQPGEPNLQDAYFISLEAQHLTEESPQHVR